MRVMVVPLCGGAGVLRAPPPPPLLPLTPLALPPSSRPRLVARRPPKGLSSRVGSLAWYTMYGGGATASLPFLAYPRVAPVPLWAVLLLLRGGGCGSCSCSQSKGNSWW